MLAEQVTGALRTQLLEAELYAVLLREHESRGISIHPNRIYSPGSYAQGLMLAAGLDPLLHRFPGFDRQVLATSAAAYHGGENRIGLLVPSTVPLPVSALDYTGGHVAVATLIGVWDVLTARSLAVRSIDVDATGRWVGELTVRLRRWLEHPTPRCPLSEEEMRRLAWTVVDVIPREDILPHRRRNEFGTSWRMQVGPLRHDDALPFVLLDHLRSSVETGAIPTIVTGHRLVSRGRVPLNDVLLPDGSRVPGGENLPLALATFRQRVKQDASYPQEERDRLSTWAKLVADAMVSGLTFQVNRSTLGHKVALRVWRHDGTAETIRSKTKEEPGPWSFPPIASAVTAGQRFLTMLARRLVEAKGGHVPYIATDALHVISSVDGTGVVAEGGPDLVWDAESKGYVPGYRALTFAEVDEVRGAIEVFSPYPSPGGPG